MLTFLCRSRHDGLRVMALLLLASSPALFPARAHADDMAATEDAHVHHGGMRGALAPTAATREASGTSWQPDSSPHAGIHLMAGDWMIMTHALINGVYDWQEGPEGGRKAFLSGMIMATARRDVSDGTLNFRAMASPDPFMGKRGYPLLLASGETADGTTPLINRQHPHEMIMELSASYSHQVASDTGMFLYAGLPGEPAFGPPAFMHRLSAMDSPEAPISHHWLDSTHITAGVVTLGLVHDNWKLDLSRFTGREPNKFRFDIDHPRFDSTSARVTWNPGARWSLQVSWADVKSPEQLEPLDNQTRWSASAIYTMPVGDAGYWSTTLAWGRKEISNGPRLDAGTIESAIKPDGRWTFFSRGEIVRSNELDPHAAQGHGTPETAGKASLGIVRDFPVARHVKFGVGGLYTFNWLPQALQADYGGNPNGAMAFVRLKIE
jgi:hypothetical protein